MQNETITLQQMLAAVSSSGIDTTQREDGMPVFMAEQFDALDDNTRAGLSRQISSDSPMTRGSMLFGVATSALNYTGAEGDALFALAGTL